nr:unnamed protein product [Digitaria exilis]
MPSKGPSRQTPLRRSSRLKTLGRGSKLEGDVHPRAGVSVTFKARQPSSRETFTLELAFPSCSRLGKLELTGQARACHAGNSARYSAAITTDDNDSPLRSKRRIHCTTLPPTLRRRHRSNPPGTVGPDSDTVPTTPLTLLTSDALPSSKATLEGDYGVATLEVLSCHEKNITRSWEARFPLASALSSVSTTSTCNHALPLRPIKGEGKLMQRAEGLGSSSPSPTLLVTPYYRDLGVHLLLPLACNPLLRATRNRCSAPLLDVRPRGRNQDKNSRLSTRHRGSEWLASQSLRLISPLTDDLRPHLLLNPRASDSWNRVSTSGCSAYRRTLEKDRALSFYSSDAHGSHRRPCLNAHGPFSPSSTLFYSSILIHERSPVGGSALMIGAEDYCP